MSDRLRRILIIPRVLWDGAWSFWGWQFISKNTVKPTEVQDYLRRRNLYGWLSAAMDVFWSQYVVAPKEKKRHFRKNLGSEWFRLFAQEGYKITSFVVLFLVLLIFVTNALQFLTWSLL